jgi:hypothetical protein
MERIPHFEEYDPFEEEMNSRYAISYQKNMILAVLLVPAVGERAGEKNRAGKKESQVFAKKTWKDSQINR